MKKVAHIYIKVLTLHTIKNCDILENIPMSSVLLFILLTLVSLSWAGSFIIVDIVSESISPIDLGFLRFIVATPLLLLIVLSQRKSLKLPMSTISSLLLLGLTGVTFLYLFQFVGIALTNASTGSVLINTNVLFIALLSILVFHERFTWRKSLGISLSFSGVIVILFTQHNAPELSLSTLFVLGILFVLISAFCWAVFSIMGKRLLQQYDEQVILLYAFVIGTFLYLPFVIPRVFSTLQTMTLFDWGGVLYLAVACSLFAYFGWYYALKRIEASKAAVFLNLIPLFTILMDWIRGIQPSLLFLVGAGVIIGGVYLTQQARTKETQ